MVHFPGVGRPEGEADHSFPSTSISEVVPLFPISLYGLVSHEAQRQLTGRISLLLTVGQSVRLGFEPRAGIYGNIFERELYESLSKSFRTESVTK